MKYSYDDSIYDGTQWQPRTAIQMPEMPEQLGPAAQPNIRGLARRSGGLHSAAPDSGGYGGSFAGNSPKSVAQALGWSGPRPEDITPAAGDLKALAKSAYQSSAYQPEAVDQPAATSVGPMLDLMQAVKGGRSFTPPASRDLGAPAVAPLAAPAEWGRTEAYRPRAPVNSGEQRGVAAIIRALREGSR